MQVNLQAIYKAVQKRQNEHPEESWIEACDAISAIHAPTSNSGFPKHMLTVRNNRAHTEYMLTKAQKVSLTQTTRKE